MSSSMDPDSYLLIYVVFIGLILLKGHLVDNLIMAVLVLFSLFDEVHDHYLFSSTLKCGISPFFQVSLHLRGCHIPSWTSFGQLLSSWKSLGRASILCHYQGDLESHKLPCFSQISYTKVEIVVDSPLVESWINIGLVTV